jgi:hypothetical protein
MVSVDAAVAVAPIFVGPLSSTEGFRVLDVCWTCVGGLAASLPPCQMESSDEEAAASFRRLILESLKTKTTYVHLSSFPASHPRPLRSLNISVSRFQVLVCAVLSLLGIGPGSFCVSFLAGCSTTSCTC